MFDGLGQLHVSAVGQMPTGTGSFGTFDEDDIFFLYEISSYFLSFSIVFFLFSNIQYIMRASPPLPRHIFSNCFSAYNM
jgi:hypothetical protein